MAIMFHPSVGHPMLTGALSHIFALPPDMAVLRVVPVPVAGRVDVAWADGSILNHHRWRTDVDIDIDPCCAGQWVDEQ
jgi:hypothetical protein